MRLLRWTARTAGAGLIGLHAWILASQWSAGRLSTDPALILRWAAALVLAAALIWLGREGTSLGVLSFNRRTIIVWLLAALLHGPAVASHGGDLQTLPETAASLVIQTTATAGVLIAALWLIVGVLRRRATANSAWSFAGDLPTFVSSDDGFSLVVSARPPPARS